MPSEPSYKSVSDTTGRAVYMPSGSTEIVPSAARTVTVNHDAWDVSKFRGLCVTIDPNVTAASGTSPTLDLIVQQSSDGYTWHDTNDVKGAAFAQVTAVINPAAKSFQIKGNLLRIRAVIGGTTPSFTYVVTLS